jgi:hypothetical protein
MTCSEKLLLFALESCRPEQVDEMLEMARDKNVPLTESCHRTRQINAGWLQFGGSIGRHQTI